MLSLEVCSNKRDSDGSVQVTSLLTYTVPLSDDSLGWEQSYAVRWRTIDKKEETKYHRLFFM